MVGHLIDTVVSNRVAGIDIDLNYNIYNHQLLVPDLTLFVNIDEELRQERITRRGKSSLDKVLDDEEKRIKFYEEFKKNLPENTIFVNNNSQEVNITANKVYRKIKEIEKKIT